MCYATYKLPFSLLWDGGFDFDSRLCSSWAQSDEQVEPSIHRDEAESFPAAMPNAAPGDLPATSVDLLMKGKGWSVTAIDSSLLQKGSVQVATTAESDGSYTLQFEAVGDFDAAQKRRWALQARSGYQLNLIFDPPFYKIRGGSFDRKEKAEDAVRRLQDAGVTAFVIKLK